MIMPEHFTEQKSRAFFILGSILDHIIDPKRDKLFWRVTVFPRGMSNAICDLVLYLKSEGLKIS